VTVGWLNSTGRYGRRCWTNIFSEKFFHVPLGVGGWPLGYEERIWWANCSRNYSFQDFQPMWSRSPETDKGRAIAVPRFAPIVHRAVKTSPQLFVLMSAKLWHTWTDLDTFRRRNVRLPTKWSAIKRVVFGRPIYSTAVGRILTDAARRAASLQELSFSVLNNHRPIVVLV